MRKLILIASLCLPLSGCGFIAMACDDPNSQLCHQVSPLLGAPAHPHLHHHKIGGHHG